MNEEKKILGYYDYTVVLTYIGMIMGVTGLTFVMDGKFSIAVFCLMLAGVCDMFDGAVASTKQRNDSEKKFGIQIDSLSDLICFGVLPGLFVYKFSGENPFGMIVSAGYILCALIRLAYFNVCEEDRQRSEAGSRKYYQGVPVTTIALVLPAVYLIAKEPYIFIFLAAIMGTLFLSPIRIKKPHALGKTIMGIAGVAELFILILGVVEGI